MDDDVAGLTDPQRFALLCMLDDGRAHSGRAGHSANTLRALDRRGLCTISAVYTWETFWRLTAKGREVAEKLRASHRCSR